MGMWELSATANLLSMQLIPIGEVRQKTVLDLVQEMAARQFAEIEQLKRKSQTAMQQRSTRSRSRCNESKGPA